ncbi:family 1 glycosylhydrolase [Sphingomonas sp.]|uniref:family 1 glycosylhydrolase n=1 Tax=Sphingomonas sp. TaxID=28214 RepID=UPI002D7EC218|nr:family 1 glycosylhydrolase [Sphingomonas sp.]HEU0043085.1 family 1 glycosylhydrolase [Sphingomonas sp.]
MELWGGVECTVNRVGDRFRDQTVETGHHDRIEDLARFAELGITALRYPVLWERIAPDRSGEPDWRWTDERLAEIRRLGMRPIAGLVHHGSGPAHTSLVDDDFPTLLAQFAGAAAARYPWIEEWTPVNEPLTTARFSALYGVWYPHARDDALFWRALFNQVDGVRLAMHAIRAVNPAARLIQTEDLGHHYATDAMAPIADYNNHRRWATWDLLTGQVGPDHPLWPDWERFGLADRVRAIADDPCPPDVIGLNHYVTSDRFLDHRVGNYALPAPADGFHDLTAARVLDPPPPGLTHALRQTWVRYGLPLAVTESHLGCTREEQMRWVQQSWQDCEALRDEGVDLRALTAWALLGNVDWSCLLAEERNHYEQGVFDVRGPEPRPTALAGLLRQLAAGERPSHPVVAGSGWWRREVRFEHSAFAWGDPVPVIGAVREQARPLLIAGATGTLGQAIASACRLRGLEHRLLTRAELPLDDPDAIAAVLDRLQPWAVINAAGWVRVDDAEVEEAACLEANAQGAINLAGACADRAIHCTLFSSDLVFDGRKGAGYVESDPPSPLNAYGRSKAVMELEVLANWPATLVVRTAAFFAPHDVHNFAMAVERTLRDGRRFLASDTVVTPTFVPDLVASCLDLIIDGEGGIWHLANGEPVSWAGFARRIAAALDLDPALVVEAEQGELGWRAARPASAALASERGQLLPTLDDAIRRHADVRLADFATRGLAQRAA